MKKYLRHYKLVQDRLLFRERGKNGYRVVLSDVIVTMVGEAEKNESGASGLVAQFIAGDDIGWFYFPANVPFDKFFQPVGENDS